MDGVERCGQAVLRREAVVDGEHDGGELGGEAEAGVVDVGHGEAAQAEAAAVEVDHHRQLLGGAGGRNVHAEAQAAVLVISHVLPWTGDEVCSEGVPWRTRGATARCTVPSLRSWRMPRQSSIT